MKAIYICIENNYNSIARELINNVDQAKLKNHTLKFHDRIIRLFISSKVFMYPKLLPEVPWRMDLNNKRTVYSPFVD